MKIYLVIYHEGDDSDILKDRIKNLGDYYRFFNNHWFVKTTLDKAEDVYDEIVKKDLSTLNIIVLNVDPKLSHNYWGFMNKALWDWLKQQD